MTTQIAETIWRGDEHLRQINSICLAKANNKIVTRKIYQGVMSTQCTGSLRLSRSIGILQNYQASLGWRVSFYVGPACHKVCPIKLVTIWSQLIDSPSLVRYKIHMFERTQKGRYARNHCNLYNIQLFMRMEGVLASVVPRTPWPCVGAGSRVHLP